jgi:RNA polymerase sigma factor (sigma-70 family)
MRQTAPGCPERGARIAIRAADATASCDAGLWYLMDDTELTERLARDLDGSFETLVRMHVDRCHAIALRVLGDPHDAEEVAQDALVRAYRALAGYDPQRIRELRLRAWLATIVVNLCRNRVRRRPVPTTPLAPLIEAGHEPPADAGSDPAAQALAGVDRERLAALLATLPDRYRIPVVLRHVDDLSYAELAEVLGRPEGTLKSQVSRGLAMLRAAATAHELEELTA